MLSDTEQTEIVLPLTGDGFGCIAANSKSLFDEANLRTLENFFSISGKALSKPGLGKRYRAQLELGGVTAFYKRYDGESLGSFLQRWWEDGERSAIAAREVNVARALGKIGIPTFKPLAWGWTNIFGARQKSFIVMSQVPGVSLERWIADNANLDWAKKIRLVEQVALLAGHLHASGWFHRDFYLCHIFIQSDGGEVRLALVDLARMFRPRWRVRRWQIKDLAQLNFSAPEKDFSRTMRLRFAKIYFGTKRFSSPQKALLRKVARRSNQIAARELRKLQQRNQTR